MVPVRSRLRQCRRRMRPTSMLTAATSTPTGAGWRSEPAKVSDAPNRTQHEHTSGCEKAGLLHHVELWVPSIERAVQEWGWLLIELGYQPFQEWPGGCSWSRALTYIVVEESPDLTTDQHDRQQPGLNHLVFHAGDRAHVDRLTDAAAQHGWTLLFPEQHPYAGGPDHYAAYLANSDGYEAEVIAASP